MLRIVVWLILGVSMISAANAKEFAKRPEVIEFIEELSREHQIDKTWATQTFNQITPLPDVITKITTPYEALPWHKYKQLYLNEKRIKGGVEFWQKYADSLQRAQKEFGVPPEIVVAIIGIESTYGKNSGQYPVLPALATLAFDYQPRAAFFRNELKEYILLITEHKLDPHSLKGSYAGAIGMPQFISSSYRNFAVDFDNSGKIDLVNNIVQVIGSVANYFKVHGWERDKPVAHRAKVTGDKYQAIVLEKNNNPKPELPLTILTAHGISPAVSLNDPDASFALLEFDNGDHKEHWLGHNNFYVITRYNKSSNYAMAVYQLSQAISKLKHD